MSDTTNLPPAGGDEPTDEDIRLKFGYGTDQGTPDIIAREDREDTPDAGN